MHQTYNNGCILLGPGLGPNDVCIHRLQCLHWPIRLEFIFYFTFQRNIDDKRTNERICRNNCFYWSRSQKPIIVPHTHSYEFGFDVVRLKITSARYTIDLPRISIEKNSLNLIVRLTNGWTELRPGSNFILEQKFALSKQSNEILLVMTISRKSARITGYSRFIHCFPNQRNHSNQMKWKIKTPLQHQLPSWLHKNFSLFFFFLFSHEKSWTFLSIYSFAAAVNCRTPDYKQPSTLSAWIKTLWLNEKL